MFNKIKNFFQNRKERKHTEEFNRGYEYAAGQLLKGFKTPMALDWEQDTEFDGGPNYSRFDNGMNWAIQDAIDKDLVEDDRI